MTVGRIRLPGLGAALLAAGLLAACSSASGPGESSSASPTRPAHLRDARAAYVAFDSSSSRWRSYGRLWTSTILGADRRPLLPEGVETSWVAASGDGSTLVFDAFPAVRRDDESGTAPSPTWWWVDSAGGSRPVLGMPADLMALAVAGDGSAVLVVAGQRRATSWPVERIDLASGARTTVCDACIRQPRPDLGTSGVQLAVSDDGALLATAAWSTSLASGFYGQAHDTPSADRLLALPGASMVWRSDRLLCTPVSVSDDATLVRSCGADELHTATLHELVGATGASPVDRDTGIAAYAAGALPQGWWYATQAVGDSNGSLAFHETTDLTPASSSLVATWPGGVQIDDLVLSTVSSIRWTGPTPSS